MKTRSKVDGYQVVRCGTYNANSSGLTHSFKGQRLSFLENYDPAHAKDHLTGKHSYKSQDINANIYKFRLESIENSNRRNRRLHKRIRNQPAHSVHVRHSVTDLKLDVRKLEVNDDNQICRNEAYLDMDQIDARERREFDPRSLMHIKTDLLTSLKDQFEIKCLQALKKNQIKEKNMEDFDTNQNDHQNLYCTTPTITAIKCRATKQLLSRAMTDEEISKDILKSLEYLDDASLDTIADELCVKISTYIVNSNTCFILKWLARKVHKVAATCSVYILENLESSLRDTNVCRMAYTLCIHFSEFRDGLLARFNANPFRLMDTIPKAVLSGLLVTHTEDLRDCRILYELLENDPTVVRRSYYCRAFAAYMNRCSIESLVRIASLFRSQMVFLLSDNLGNFLLQTFFIRKCDEGIESCKRALIDNYRKVFTKRHSRYILFRALNQDDKGIFSAKLLNQVIRSSEHVLLEIIGRKMSSKFLLYALAIAGEHMETSYYVQELKLICKKLKVRARKEIKTVIDDFLTDMNTLKRNKGTSIFKAGK